MAVDQRDVIAEMDEEDRRASEQKSSGPSPFLIIKEGQAVLIRPLYNLPDAIILMVHEMWLQEEKRYIRAVCAHAELSKLCLYCEQAKAEKKLTPNKIFFLPVHLYGLKEFSSQTRKWEPVMYKRDGVERPVEGLRILELKTFGAVRSVKSYLRERWQDSETHTITDRDFSIVRKLIPQQGVNAVKKTEYTTVHKDPTRLHPSIEIPLPTTIYDSIMAAIPPVVLDQHQADLLDTGGVGHLNGIKQVSSPFDEQLGDPNAIEY